MKNLKLKHFTVFTLILIGLDQASKLIMYYFFNDKIFLNKGIAFSISFKSILLIALSIGIIGLISYLIKTKKLDANWVWILFLAGAIGNLIDRIRIQAVIDFINLGFFPVFNFADIYLSLAGIGIVYYYILTNKYNENGN